MNNKGKKSTISNTIGIVAFVLFISAIIFMIFFVPPNMHIAMQWGELNWSRRGIVPTENGIFIAEYTQTYSKGGRNIVRLTTVSNQGDITSQRYHYGDVNVLGVTLDGIVWIDLMSNGGIKALEMPDLKLVENASDIFIKDERFSRSQQIFVDKNGLLALKTKDGHIYNVYPNKAEKLAAAPDPQIKDANSTWFMGQSEKGILSFPQSPQLRQLYYNGKPVPPSEGYLEGRLLGDRITGSPLVTPFGFLVSHTTETMDQAKFRLTCVDFLGYEMWTVNATDIVPQSPFKAYKHEIHWAGLVDEKILLYTSQRNAQKENSTLTYLISLDPEYGLVDWVVQLTL